MAAKGVAKSATREQLRPNEIFLESNVTWFARRGCCGDDDDTGGRRRVVGADAEGKGKENLPGAVLGAATAAAAAVEQCKNTSE